MSSTEEVRLQKYLASAGVCSRREAEALIQEGKVYVAGKKANLGDKIVPGEHTVRVKGKEVEPPESVAFIFHKPKAYLCNNDGRRPEQSIFVKYPILKPYRVVVGLDMKSSGLILLSNDGDLLQEVAVQYKDLERKYHVRVKSEIEERSINRLSNGIRIDEQTVSVESIKLLKRENEKCWYEVSLVGHKDKSLDKLFMAIGHQAQRVIQVSIAGLRDDTLKPGKGRVLTTKELNLFKSQLGYQI